MTGVEKIKEVRNLKFVCILARNGLTCGQTGWYESDESEDIPVKGAIVPHGNGAIND